MPIAVEDAHVRKVCEQSRRGSGTIVVDLDGDERRLFPDRGRDPRGADTRSGADLREPAVRSRRSEHGEQPPDLPDRRALEAHRGRERLGAVNELWGLRYDGVTL